MADGEMEKLPVVLQLQPVPAIAPVEDRFLKKFRFLKAWESSMAIDLFLTTHAQSVRALLCHGQTPVPADVLQYLPSLQCIVTTSAGLNHIDLAECRRRGIAIANASTSFSEDGADYAVGLCLDVFRRISAADRYVRQGLWPTKGMYPLATKEKNYKDRQKMEKLLVVLQLRPVPVIAPVENRFLKNFRFLKAWESSMPLDLFLTTHAQSVRALLCSGGTLVTADALRCLPSLQCIVTTSAGLNHIDLAECRRRGIAIANSGDCFSENVADYAIGLLIDVLRRISAADRYVRQGLWPTKGEYPLGSRLGGKRVGIVGLGHIGSEVAKRLVAFGCSISYNSRKKKPSFAFPYHSDVRDLAANSDVLILCCALTKETNHIINRDVMLALGEKGVIINIGRGALIDEKELIQCLMQGEIGGAGLDVFENEPNVPKELLALDNVVLSPHKAVLTPESFMSLHDLLLANLEAFFSNKPLVSEVKDD